MHKLFKLFLFTVHSNVSTQFLNKVKLSNKEVFDKELIGITEPFPETNYFIRIRSIWH